MREREGDKADGMGKGDEGERKRQRCMDRGMK